MKALTLWQPWASLVAIGAKEIETRSWQTRYRGKLAIHAAKRKPELADDETGKYMMDALASENVVWSMLPLGAIVAICELVDCYPVEELWPDLTSMEYEQAFGNYSAGRFAWELGVVKMVDPPIPARGFQGLWEWRDA